MTNLTDTQRLVLTAAADRPDRALLPLPAHLKGGAIAKVTAALVARGLAEHAPAARRTGLDEDGLAGDVLVATPEALRALGLKAPGSPDGSDDSVAATDGKATPKVRNGTKQAAVIAMLEAEGGVTIAEIMAATGWQAHTARGFLSGALRKRLGLPVQSETAEGRGRVYRIER